MPNLFYKLRGLDVEYVIEKVAEHYEKSFGLRCN